jgi:Ca2+-binding RTX toxin-like protein
MKSRGSKVGAALAAVAALAAIAPGAASARPVLAASVSTIHGQGATMSASMNVLTVNDLRGVDNRISVFTGPTGRFTLTAPEGLGDPDGSGAACTLDNAKTGELTAQEVSCAPGYIGAIVGDLGRGNDTFDADPLLGVMVGDLPDQRPLSGGPGRDRLVGGGLGDLLEGAGGQDSLAGGNGADLLMGGPGADKLSGGTGRDLCRGASGFDVAKGCDTARGIP